MKLTKPQEDALVVFLQEEKVRFAARQPEPDTDEYKAAKGRAYIIGLEELRKLKERMKENSKTS